VAVVGSGWIRTGCGSPPACTMDADTVAGRKVHITFGAFALIEIASSLYGYTNDMDYNVGSRIRVRLYSGKFVEAEITAIVNQSTGRKIRISFGKESVSINPEQIIEVLP